MIRRLKTVLSGITSRIGENHLRHVHNRMALSSLSEHDCWLADYFRQGMARHSK